MIGLHTRATDRWTVGNAKSSFLLAAVVVATLARQATLVHIMSI